MYLWHLVEGIKLIITTVLINKVDPLGGGCMQVGPANFTKTSTNFGWSVDDGGFTNSDTTWNILSSTANTISLSVSDTHGCDSSNKKIIFSTNLCIDTHYSPSSTTGSENSAANSLTTAWILVVALVTLALY
jgi:hypothetical protein